MCLGGSRKFVLWAHYQHHSATLMKLNTDPPYGFFSMHLIPIEDIETVYKGQGPVNSLNTRDKKAEFAISIGLDEVVIISHLI